MPHLHREQMTSRHFNELIDNKDALELLLKNDITSLERNILTLMWVDACEELDQATREHIVIV